MCLTLEDPNANMRGSQDPLGAQPVWATFGRHVVTNLTVDIPPTGDCPRARSAWCKAPRRI